MTKKKQGIDWKIIVGGMICLTIAECYAISQGINGLIFKIYVGIIAGAIGITIPTPKLKK